MVIKQGIYSENLVWNGSSVADYVVVSQSIYDNIEYFKVREYIPWLSDHSAVSYKLSTTTGRYVPGGINDFGEVYESIFWDKNSFWMGLRNVKMK